MLFSLRSREIDLEMISAKVLDFPRFIQHKTELQVNRILAPADEESSHTMNIAYVRCSGLIHCLMKL